MTFITSQITDDFIAYLGDVKYTSLSLIVSIIDDYTGKESIGPIKVMLKEGNIKSFKNPSGYYLFNNLVGGNCTISIKSDYYFPEERTVDTSKIPTPDVTLEFDNSGPSAKATNTRLKDVSKLQNGNLVEFCNSGGQIEQRRIIDIDVNNKAISWTRGLKYDFSNKGSNVKVLKYNILEILLKPRSSYPFPNNATLVRGLVSNTDPVVDCSIVVNENITTKTDERGEFVLFFKGIGNKENDITIKINKNGSTKEVDTSIKKGKMIYLGLISFP